MSLPLHESLNRTSLWIARHRTLQRYLAPLLPETATFEVIREIQVEIPLGDRTGPGFYLNYGGPAAFYHYGEIEKLELASNLKPGGIFLDIGANIGLFSMYLARVIPQLTCFAFEPHPTLANCLRRSIQRSPFSSIQVEELCISNCDNNEVSLFTHRLNSGGNSIVANNVCQEEIGNKISVKSMSLDSWAKQKDSALKQVGAIKVDVQGAEGQVLEGASQILTQFRPFLLIEIENQQVIQREDPWEKLLKYSPLKTYFVRVTGTQEVFPFSELPIVARRLHSEGQLQTNYSFLPE